MERFCPARVSRLATKRPRLKMRLSAGGPAVQTGASASERIASDLADIDGVRAAAHADPTSPTGVAVRDWHETLGLTQKTISVDNIIAQSNQEASDAAYLRSAAKTSLLSGYQPIAVVLDLVHPIRAGRRLGIARRDAGDDTRQCARSATRNGWVARRLNSYMLRVW
jgi:hypothetical protein